jgi:hypothetical protein
MNEDQWDFIFSEIEGLIASYAIPIDDQELNLECQAWSEALIVLEKEYYRAHNPEAIRRCVQ